MRCAAFTTATPGAIGGSVYMSGATAVDVLFSLIDESYRAVAPKRILKELDLSASRR